MQEDKVIHFCVGGVIGIVAARVCAFFYDGIPMLALVAFVSALIAGATKEMIDLKFEKGTPEWADFFATCLGGLAASILIITCF